MSVRARFFGGWALGGLIGLGLALALSQPAVAGDPEAGKKVAKKCLACHTLEPGKKKIGPSLHGIIGRTPGTLAGFKYSKAMVAFGQSGAVWDEETIEVFLVSPKKLVKGTRMSFPGLKKPEDRANLIAYLKQVMAAN